MNTRQTDLISYLKYKQGLSISYNDIFIIKKKHLSQIRHVTWVITTETLGNKVFK